MIYLKTLCWIDLPPFMECIECNCNVFVVAIILPPSPNIGLVFISWISVSGYLKKTDHLSCHYHGKLIGRIGGVFLWYLAMNDLCYIGHVTTWCYSTHPFSGIINPISPGGGGALSAHSLLISRLLLFFSRKRIFFIIWLLLFRG